MNELTIINNYFTEDCISQMPEKERRIFQETCNSIEKNATKKYITELGDLVTLSGFVARQKEEDFKSKIPEFLNVIVLVRNELMYGEDYSDDVFQNLISSCEAVCNCLGIFAESGTFAPDVDTSEYQKLNDRAKEIKSQLDVDAQFAPGFFRMRRDARADYQRALKYYQGLSDLDKFFYIAFSALKYWGSRLIFRPAPANERDAAFDEMMRLREIEDGNESEFVNPVAYNDYIKKQRELIAKQQQESGKSESGGYSV